MYATIIISISRSVWRGLSLDAHESFQNLTNEFISTVNDEVGHWEDVIEDTDEMITFSASAFNDTEEVA